MKTNLSDLLRNAAEAINPRKDHGAYAYMLGEIADHVDMVRADPDNLGQFCRIYDLPAPIDAPAWGGASDYQSCARTHALVETAVAAAMQDFGPIHPDHAREAAYRIATAAAINVLRLVYDRDGEIKELRAINQHLMDTTLRMSNTLLVPPRLIKEEKP